MAMAENGDSSQRCLTLVWLTSWVIWLFYLFIYLGGGGGGGEMGVFQGYRVGRAFHLCFDLAKVFLCLAYF